MVIDGILNVNKPRGMTSHDVVGMVRRLAGQKRVGHAGTLDPMAEGVLVVALGRATRLIEYIVNTRKVYCTEIVLGVTTTTYDAEGQVVERVPTDGITREQIEAALSAMTGTIQQVPPMYSALKVGGKKLYELARRGVEVEREAREVTIHRVQVLAWENPVLALELEVSKGTYIRSFAHDVGQRLGVGGYMHHLVRVASGQFTIDDALTPLDLELAFRHDYWSEVLFAADEGMLELDAVVVGERHSAGLRMGQSWPGSRPHDGAGRKPVRAYSWQGDFLGVVEFNTESNRWQPTKVLV